MLQQKRNKEKIDFIIVGQGIAGSVIALTLIKAGYIVQVIDQPHLSLSSKIAAGIWNPIVFKRLTKSWLADDLVPELLDFYTYWENEFNTKFIHHRNIIKPFTEEQEKLLWLKKANTEESPNLFLDKNVYENLQIDENYSVQSYSKVLNAGNLDVLHFIESTRKFLITSGMYVEEEFNYDRVDKQVNEIKYNSISSSNIVFCDGHLISNNPFFSWVPMKPAKGETLTIHSTKLHLQQDIFNKGFFIMPLGNNNYKIGATYEWQELNDLSTEKGKIELLKKLNDVIKTPFDIISHDAGVRPSVIDRRPLVGRHPDHQNLYIFNGLGTKAVMIAPYFANKLLNLIQTDCEINNEVNPVRFR